MDDSIFTRPFLFLTYRTTNIMDNFNSLELPQAILASLERMKFTTPTPIQKDTIPAALLGRDILGSAPTGTGKTGAFSIPMLAWLLKNKDGRALIMTPTRELATQVLNFVHQLIHRNNDISTALLIGGDSFYRQKQQLQRNPRIIVGTPGRINDHLNQKTLNLSKVGFLVLDETDRMLDMGFREQLQTILDKIATEHQTLLFSATLPKHILDLSKQYLTDAVRVSVGSTNIPVDRIKQETIHTTDILKHGKLIEKLQEHTGSIIVFAKTKHGCDKLAMKLRHDGHNADAIHGDLNQRARDRVIKAFRDQQFRILVATDVAARGLDIRHIECVINFDMPQCPEDYIHRIGRTARAGADGHAVNFITGIDGAKWRAIQKLINPNAKLDPLPSSERPRSRKRYGEPQRSGSYQQRDRKPSGSSWQPRQNSDRSRPGSSNSDTTYAQNRRSANFSKETQDGPTTARSDYQVRRNASPQEGRAQGGYQSRRPATAHGELHDSRPQGGYQTRKPAAAHGEQQDRRPSASKYKHQDKRTSSNNSSSRPRTTFNTRKPGESTWSAREKKTTQ